jgi:Short C-terminal domain
VSGKYWIRTLVGLAICGAAVVALDWGLYNVVRTGTCGVQEGGFVAPPCPPGTGLHIMGIIGGVFAGLIGIGIYATRGEGGQPGRVGLGAIMWFLLFVTIALSVAWSAFGPANTDSTAARGVAIAFAFTFIPMGLAPILFSLKGPGRKQRLAQQLMATGRRCTGEVMSVDDTGITINDNPRVKITVRAEPPGETPFTIVKTATVSRVSIPRRGDRCTVFYDPADRENRNGITFDPVPGMPWSGPATSPSAPWPGSPPTTTAAPPPSTASAGSAGTAGTASIDDDEEEDPFAKIERLGQLRDRGLITQDEFDEQKRRLLGEV